MAIVSVLQPIDKPSLPFQQGGSGKSKSGPSRKVGQKGSSLKKFKASKGKSKKKHLHRFLIDCSHPVEDQIMAADDFVRSAATRPV